MVFGQLSGIGGISPFSNFSSRFELEPADLPGSGSATFGEHARLNP
jgi:hypothetical protein